MGGLVKHNPNDDFISKMHHDKELRKEVREESSTSPRDLEKKRQELGYLINRTRKDISAIFDLAGERADKKTSKDRKDEIDDTLRTMMPQVMIMNGFAQAYAQSILIDCVTVAYEYVEEIKDKANGTKKVKVFVRPSISEIIYEGLMGGETDAGEDDPARPGMVDLLSALVSRAPTAEQMQSLMRMFYRVHKNAHDNKPPFYGPVAGPGGVMTNVEDMVEHSLQELERRMAEDSARSQAQQAQVSARPSGVTEEEAHTIKNKGLQDFLRENS